MITQPLQQRMNTIDWHAIEDSLGHQGYALTGQLLTPETCAQLQALFDQDTHFRRRIDMARHAFGQGAYAYFAEPLPPVVHLLRDGLYTHLAPIANRMMQALRETVRYPDTLAEFRDRCARAGQTQPTPLLLHYRTGDYNRLHRDLYGDHLFPLQCTFLLSQVGVDFDGGEFLLVEQRARQQSIGTVVPLQQGVGVIFPVHTRPVPGKRGILRAYLRHGVSPVTRGERYTLGIIFHDAA